MAAIPADKRKAIIRDIRAVKTGKSTKSRNAIGREHQVSVSTVTAIAQAEGLGDAFDRTRTAAATKAKSIDCRAAREQLKEDLLGDAQRLRARAWAEYEVVVSTPKGAQTVILPVPPLTDVRAAYSAMATAIDKALRLEQYDAADESGASAVDEWLRTLVGESR